MNGKRKTRRLVVWIVVLTAAGIGGALYWRNGVRSAEQPYRTATIDRGDVVLTVTATGTLSAVTTVQVGSQVSGIIARLHADFNSPVKKGQPLAELDPTPFEAQVAQRRADLTQAEVQFRNAKIGFERSERLIEEGLIPASEYDTAKAGYDAALAQVDMARASLDQATTNLSYTRILSPIDGVVVARQYDVGQTVAASFQAPTLFTIAQDLTKMQVLADVDQSDIGRVLLGQEASFTVDAYPEEAFRGRITQIRLNATVNQNVITYPVIIEVSNPEGKLRPQMTADVSIEVDRVHDVLRVPNAALRFRLPEDSNGPRGAGRAVRTERPEPSAGGAGGAGGAEGRIARGEGEGRGPARMARDLEAALGARSETAGRQTVHLLRPDGKVEAVRVRTGISDGRFTSVVEGEIEEGQTVLVGMATATARSGSDPGGPPRGPRMF